MLVDDRSLPSQVLNHCGRKAFRQLAEHPCTNADTRVSAVVARRSWCVRNSRCLRAGRLGCWILHGGRLVWDRTVRPTSDESQRSRHHPENGEVASGSTAASVHGVFNHACTLGPSAARGCQVAPAALRPGVLAERGGFEPLEPVRVQRFSRGRTVEVEAPPTSENPAWPNESGSPPVDRC